MNNISFTGFKNVGSYCIKFNSGKMGYVLAAELTNSDVKDLDNFSKILKRYPNLTNRNFITIAAGDCLGENPLSVNLNEIPLKDHNLEIYERVVKFLKRIASLPGKSSDEIPLNLDYIESDDVHKILGIELTRDASKEERLEQLLEIHNSLNAKDNADVMYRFIKNKVEKFFKD